jgi:hypothetical protein
MLFAFVAMAALFAVAVIFFRPALAQISRALALWGRDSWPVVLDGFARLWGCLWPRLRSRTVVGAWLVQGSIAFGLAPDDLDLEKWTTRLWLLANVAGFALTLIGRERFGFDKSPAQSFYLADHVRRCRGVEEDAERTF